MPAPPSEQRPELAAEFHKRFHQLIDSLGNGEEDWAETFTVDQINSYLEEEFARVRPVRLPEAIHSPRVAIEPNRLRLAFRYGRGLLSCLVTVDLKIWLVAQEVNLIAVEVLDLRAGALSVRSQSILERITENASAWKVEVNWYRHGRNPVALIRLQPDQPNPSVILEQLELQDQRLRLAGKSSEPLVWNRSLTLQGRPPRAVGE
jgi:hypothetical protein